MRTRIDAIIAGIRDELEHRPQALEGGGLKSLYLHIQFEGEKWDPRAIIVRPEFYPSPRGAKELKKA